MSYTELKSVPKIEAVDRSIKIQRNWITVKQVSMREFSFLEVSAMLEMATSGTIMKKF